MLFKICPLTMRAQAILLVRDAVPFLNVSSDDGEYASTRSVAATQSSPAHESSRWRRSCDRLIPLLDEYSNTLLRNLQRFIEIGDNTGAEIIWSSCIICLTHLTALCELVGRVDSTASSEMDRICDCGLEKLGHLTEDVRSEEYTHLDLLLGVRIRGFSRSRSSSCADEETGLVFLEKIPDRV
jgi:hypothetical protein